MNNPDLQKSISDISTVLSKIDNREDIYSFLRDLLSEKEIIELSQRFRVAQLLDEKVPYVQIEKQTWMSSTTIARVSKFLNGQNNGYKKALSILRSVSKKHHDDHCS